MTSCEVSPKTKQLVAFGGDNCKNTYSSVNGRSFGGSEGGERNRGCSGRDCERGSSQQRSSVSGTIEGSPPPIGRSVRFKHYDYADNVSVTEWFRF